MKPGAAEMINRILLRSVELCEAETWRVFNVGLEKDGVCDGK